MSDIPQDGRPADGVLILCNRRPHAINLLVEPSGLVYEMPPGASFHVRLSSAERDLPLIEYEEDLIILHAYRAIISHNGRELYNLSD